MATPFFRVSLLLAIGAVLGISAASTAADPDPTQLLLESAKAIESADSASVDLKVGTKLVRDSVQDDMVSRFAYRTAPGGRFELVSVDQDGERQTKGYDVAGNGEVLLTALLSRRRHMLEPDVDGLATFVRSPGAQGIGSGLGPLALALLNRTATEELVASVKSAEFLGEEEVDGEKLLHARYVVGGDITTDVWFAAEGAPLVRLVQPNVLATPAVQEMGSRYEKFDYQLRFEFENWNTDAGLTADDVAVVEPKNSILMASLYQMPEPPPHPLLGREAPQFELLTAGGDRVEVERPNGDGGVLLEFWATSCPMCLQAMPILEELHDKYASRGLKYVAVNVNDAPEEVAAFLEKRGKKLSDSLVDDLGEASTAYKVSMLPLIVMVGPDGRVQITQEGFARELAPDLDAAVDAALSGVDLASEQLEIIRQQEARRVSERKRLRSLLDG